MSRWITIIGFCLLPWLAHGGVYQWVDKQGRVHFGNVPPQQQGEYEIGNIKYLSVPVSEKQEKVKADLSEQGLSKEKTTTPPSGKPGVDADTKNEVSPKRPQAKFHDRHELKTFIERLRKDAKPPHSLRASSPVDKKPQSSKKAKAEKSQPVVDAQAVVEKKDDSKTSGADEKAGAVQPNSEGSNTSAVDAKKVVPEKNTVTEKDADKCGVFSGFVVSYETKVSENCPGAHCSVYKRSLKRYKLKQKRYCD